MIFPNSGKIDISIVIGGNEMKVENKYEYYLRELREALPLVESFDVMERNFSIGDHDATIFFVDGLVKTSGMQWILAHLLTIAKKDVDRATSAELFIKYNMPFLDSLVESKIDMILKHIFAGLVPIVIDGFDEVMIIDAREYPARGVEEPSKEKSLRGAKDGFTEGFMTNIALIRRHIRDKNLIFEAHMVGTSSRTDVAVTYIKGIADDKVVKSIRQRIDDIQVDTLTVGEQSLVELFMQQNKKKSDWFNPFPKVRYTQRPDVVAAHVSEGKIAIIVDNTPTVILLPVGIFDFVQDVDDYYFPLVTGNYFRLLRILNMIAIIFMTPVYLLMAEGYIPTFEMLGFIIPDTNYAIPLFWQFILLEIAIDALKLASLNTPDSLGMSLSVIGALILGEFSVQSGWFIPQTILCMAVMALASFTQPSIELGYAIKFVRIAMLIGVAIYGFYGAGIAFVLGLVVLASTKTLMDTSYLYPLFPLNAKALKRLIFRTRK